MNRQKKSRQRSRRFDGYKLALLHDIRKILLIAAAVVILFNVIFGFSVVDGVSMKDTFQNGDLVFYHRLNLSINVGDIVSVRLPSGQYYIKRVIAKGGDTIDLRDGVIYVNGQPENGSYVRGKTLPENGAFTYPYTVREGDIFVLGDNREESVDSRSFGGISLNQVRGKIRFGFRGLSIRFY